MKKDSSQESLRMSGRNENYIVNTGKESLHSHASGNNLQSARA